MSYKVAERITSDTGHHVEWAPANREYVVWPEGVPCSTAKEARKYIGTLKIIPENTPDQKFISPGETIELVTRFGGLPRGKCWGKRYPVGSDGYVESTRTWVPRRRGTLIITDPGYYVVGSDDGFHHRAKVAFVLKSK